MISPGLGPENLVLASGSKIRSQILTAAGMLHEICPSQIDERAIEASMVSADAAKIGLALARSKATDVSGRRPGALVLGADQTLSLGGELLHKAADMSAARTQLMALRGRTHQLHSAISFVRNSEVLFEHVATAALTVRAFSEDFLDAYISQAGEAILTSVGCYHIEGLGAHLFEKIEGDQFTIMGLPLLPLQKYLRIAGFDIS